MTEDSRVYAMHSYVVPGPRGLSQLQRSHASSTISNFHVP